MTLRRRRLSPVKAGLLAGIVAGSFLAAAAGPQTAQQPTLKYEVSVTLKLVQVYVTDKSGRPVRDLTRDEFRVTDDGRPVTISAFEKHDLAEAPAGAPAAAPSPAPAIAAAAEAAAQSRKFIILFDFAFNTARGVQASLEAAGHFLDAEVRPDDELAFVSYSMLKGLRIHEFLTTDHAKIKEALAKISTKDIAGRADDVEQAYWQLVDLAKSSGAGRRALVEMERERWDSIHQAQNYFRDLTRFAKALRLVQGQKSVLYFSNGVPSSLINASRGVGTDSIISGGGGGVSRDGMGGNSPQRGSTFQVGNYELRPLQEAMLKEFSASGCSFFAFDTRESSKIPALFDIDQLAQRVGVGAVSADNNVFRDDKLTGMDSLKKLSKETGGKYYSNIILHEKNLEEVSAVTATYYVLGYSIPAATDGRFHSVKIEVRRKGCQVRTQPGYFNPKPFKEYTDLEKSIQLFDLALNERSEFQAPRPLTVSALFYDAGTGGRARVLVRIPGEVWRQFGGETAEIVALFFDARDDLTSLQRMAVVRTDYVGRDVLFTAGAAAGPGTNTCRVVVRDLDTGQSAVGGKTVFNAKLGARGLSVFTPVAVVPGGGLFHLEGVVKGAAESPSWREVYRYDPAVARPIVGDEAVKAGTVDVIVPYSAPGLGPGDLTFRANLVDSGSAANMAVPVELKELAKPGTIDVQRLEVSLAGFPDGKYVLYIHVGNKITGQVASANAPLTITR